MSKKILVVDDDGEIRASLADVLTDRGYDVSVAANGREALDVLSRERPEVILLDLMMPIMDGWELRAEIDKRPDVRGIPVIVVSADANVREKAAQVRADAYLRKPVWVEDLLDALARVA